MAMDDAELTESRDALTMDNAEPTESCDALAPVCDALVCDALLEGAELSSPASAKFGTILFEGPALDSAAVSEALLMMLDEDGSSPLWFSSATCATFGIAG